MSIRQPIQTTIHATDFHQKSYTFNVESVVDPGIIPAQLVVSVSTGYRLTTSQTNQANSKQTFTYTKHLDGSWIASGTVTLLVDGESLGNGTVIISDSLGETVTVIIVGTGTDMDLLSIPLLTVSQSALNFTPTRPGKPSFLVLTVTQQGVNEPIKLITDTPEVFQLASDNHPNFAPVITLQPSTTVLHIHVRYLTRKAGVHKGQLFIQSDHEQKTIPLVGLSSIFLPKIRTILPERLWILRGRTDSLLISARLLILPITACLLYVSYNNRCTLFPNLCEEAIQNNVHERVNKAFLISNPESTMPTAEKAVKIEGIAQVKATDLPNQLALENKFKRELNYSQKGSLQLSNFPKKKSVFHKLPNDKNRTQSSSNQLNTPIFSNLKTEESELENELNQLPILKHHE